MKWEECICCFELGTEQSLQFWHEKESLCVCVCVCVLPVTSLCKAVDSGGLRCRASCSQGSKLCWGCWSRSKASSVMKEGRDGTSSGESPKDVIRKVSPSGPSLRADFSPISHWRAALYRWYLFKKLSAHRRESWPDKYWRGVEGDWSGDWKEASEKMWTRREGSCRGGWGVAASDGSRGRWEWKKEQRWESGSDWSGGTSCLSLQKKLSVKCSLLLGTPSAISPSVSLLLTWGEVDHFRKRVA